MKNVKAFQNFWLGVQLMWKLYNFSSFLHFTMLTRVVFWKNNKGLKHLTILLRIFFVLGVFKNLDVHFFTLLKAEKVRSSSSSFFSSNFFFISLIWIYKLLLSWINQNTSHCYTLNITYNERFKNPRKLKWDSRQFWLDFLSDLLQHFFACF